MSDVEIVVIEWVADMKLVWTDADDRSWTEALASHLWQYREALTVFLVHLFNSDPVFAILDVVVIKLVIESDLGEHGSREGSNWAQKQAVDNQRYRVENERGNTVGTDRFEKMHERRLERCNKVQWGHGLTKRV